MKPLFIIFLFLAHAHLHAADEHEITATIPPAKAQKKDKKDGPGYGVLSVTGTSNIMLTIRDEAGNVTSMNLNSKTNVQEIPNSSGYTSSVGVVQEGDKGRDFPSIDIYSGKNQKFHIRVEGLKDGKASLDVIKVNSDYRSGVSEVSFDITKGQIKEFEINFNNTPGTKPELIPIEDKKAKQ